MRETLEEQLRSHMQEHIPEEMNASNQSRSEENHNHMYNESENSHTYENDNDNDDIPNLHSVEYDHLKTPPPLYQ
jgi:hypothetical protein